MSVDLRKADMVNIKRLLSLSTFLTMPEKGLSSLRRISPLDIWARVGAVD